MKITFYIFLLFLYTSNCIGKNNSENQITIKVNVIDSETNKPRLNLQDTIEVRKEEFSHLIRTYNKVGEYITDSLGSVKVTIDYNKGYKFILVRRGFYGSESFAEPFTKDRLKDGQEINIKAIPIEH